jgi:MFS family permease
MTLLTQKVHWYTPSELAKRMGFYHSCQAIGSMMSGALQVAITNTLHGTNGIAGWRWLFIINAIMTVVVGLLGFFLLPDLPNRVNPRAFWFKTGHAKLAMERLERNGRAEPKRMTWAGAKYVVKFYFSRYIKADGRTDARSTTGLCTLYQYSTYPQCWHPGDTHISTCS